MLLNVAALLLKVVPLILTDVKALLFVLLTVFVSSNSTKILLLPGERGPIPWVITPKTKALVK